MKLFCTLCFAVLLRAQEPGGGAVKPDAIPEAEKAELTGFMPVPASFGFKPKGAAQFFSSDLYKYIDGGAEAYHQYGLRAMIHQEYASKAMEVTVDLYDMGTPLSAFGIYAAERSPDYHFVGIGGEGYESDGLLNFFQREYYVKISAVSEKKAPTAPMLQTIAKYVSRKILTGPSMPAEIAWFPARGLVEHSQKYAVHSPMGRDFLAPAVTALYRFAGKETTLLVSTAADPADAARRVARLKQGFEGSGGTKAVAGLPVEAWRGTNSYEGAMIFFTKGRYAVVVMHPPSPPEAFLKEIVSSIKE